MSTPPEPYELTFETRPGYLYANLRGDAISVALIRAYVAEIVAESNATGLNRIMLYRDIPAILSEAETFFTVRESLEALRGKKLALVNPHADIDKEVKFGMTVGHNRGGNYADFEDIAAAEKWLLSDED